MKYSMLLLLIFSMVLMSCSDNGPTNSGSGITSPTAQAFNDLRNAAIDSRIQTAKFNAEDGINFTSENDVKLNIPAGCLELNGQPVNGEVTLEYMELFDKGDMLVTNRPTMGVTSQGDKKMLISGGEFFTTVTQDGDTLKANCHTIQLIVPGDRTGGVDTDMILWKGNMDENGNLAWEEAENDTASADTPMPNRFFIEGPNYFAFIDEFVPVNVDRFYSDPRPKTTLQVRTPEGYGQDNADVYLSYDGEANSLAGLDRYDDESGLFTEHYGQLPIGLEMHLIFVTEHNGQWRYAIQGVTVAEDDLYAFTLEETQMGTEQDMIGAIDALP